MNNLTISIHFTALLTQEQADSGGNKNTVLTQYSYITAR
jgi:hypothetical protein